MARAGVHRPPFGEVRRLLGIAEFLGPIITGRLVLAGVDPTTLNGWELLAVIETIAAEMYRNDGLTINQQGQIATSSPAAAYMKFRSLIEEPDFETWGTSPYRAMMSTPSAPRRTPKT